MTNKVSTTAYRGAGRPEAAVAIERILDRYADEIGMDPAEVRRINLVPRFTEPYTTGVGTVYDVGDYPEALRRALEASGYDDLLAEQRGRRERGDRSLLGIGIGMYVEITAGGPGGEFGSVELLPDGRVRVVSGATPYGQGHETTWAMIVADRTGIPMDRIDVVHGDTDLVERGGLTVGSRSVQLGGSAIAAASTQLIDRARERAAELLEAAVEDVQLDADAGAFHVAGSPAIAVSWDQISEQLTERLLEFHDFSAAQPTFPCGCHVAVVEVDRDTGGTTLQRVVAVDDAGRILNPLLAEGQVHGGIAQGAAQVLLEAIHYDEDGNLLTSNFMDYLVVSARRAPPLRGRPPRDPDLGERARRQGRRRVRCRGGDPGGLQRRHRRRLPPRRAPPRDPAEPPAGLGGAAGRRGHRGRLTRQAQSRPTSVTSVGLMKSALVQPSRSYSDMQASAMPSMEASSPVASAAFRASILICSLLPP